MKPFQVFPKPAVRSFPTLAMALEYFCRQPLGVLYSSESPRHPRQVPAEACGFVGATSADSTAALHVRCGWPLLRCDGSRPYDGEALRALAALVLWMESSVIRARIL